MYRKKSFNILFMEKAFQVFHYTEKNFPCVFFSTLSYSTLSEQTGQKLVNSNPTEVIAFFYCIAFV